MIPIATQAETQRKAAAQKGAATRRRNAAQRSRSARKAAETRARAQASTLKSFGWQAQRVADTAVGAAVTAGEKAADTVKPLRSPTGVSRQISHLRRRAATNLRKAERRGANARRRAARILRRNRREAERQVKSTQDGFERRIDHAQSAAEGLARRVGSDARSIV